jgi:type II secretory ATPase GspE/PulE/Tfp pilus assembly ATPase PilB-like protein
VLSTLHTNSAAETVTRLLDMGMDPFNFADALLGVLAQRLVRRLCTECRSAEPMPADEAEVLLDDYLHVFAGREGPSLPTREAVRQDWLDRFGSDGRLTRYRCKGCDACGGTGFRGRAGIHELMGVGREMRALIQSGTRADDLLRQALVEGTRTLRQDGIEKVLSGVTSIEEVRANS